MLVLHNRKQKTAMWSMAAVARGTACGIACMALLQLAELAAAVSPSAGGAGGHHHGAAGAAKSAQLKADVGMNVLPQGQVESPAAALGDATPGAAVPVPAAGGLMRSESSSAGARAATLKESYAAAVHAVHAAAHPVVKQAHAQLAEAAVSGDGSVQLEADSLSADGSLLELEAASESVESARAEAALESDSAGRKSASESKLQMNPLGMSATDALRKGEDILMGTTSIIPEDYPYVCICGNDGVCAKDAMETSCSGRLGAGSGAYRRAAPLGALPRLALGSASMLLSMSMLARREA